MRLGAIVLDSNDIETLSDFYARLLGWTKSSQIHDREKWITVIKADYSETPLVFQENPDYVRPTWPPCAGQQQQMIHLDWYVKLTEFEEKVANAVACGASEAKSQLSGDWRVMIDPAGHPFCIIPIPDEVYHQRYGG